MIEIWPAAFSRCSSTASTARPGCGPTSTATPQPAADVRNLAPGEQAAFKVAWSATTSTPECATAQNPERIRWEQALTVVGQLGALRKLPGAVQHRMSAGKPEQAR